MCYMKGIQGVKKVFCHVVCLVQSLHIDQVLHYSVTELDADLHECVKILNGYISELRTYLRRYPWSEGGETTSSDTVPGAAIEDEWEMRSVEVGASKGCPECDGHKSVYEFLFLSLCSL